MFDYDTKKCIASTPVQTQCARNDNKSLTNNNSPNLINDGLPTPYWQ